MNKKKPKQEYILVMKELANRANKIVLFGTTNINEFKKNLAFYRIYTEKPKAEFK